MVSVSICQVGHPGLSLAQAVCFKKVEFYQHVINLFLPVLTTGSPKAIQRCYRVYVIMHVKDPQLSVMFCDFFYIVNLCGLWTIKEELFLHLTAESHIHLGLSTVYIFNKYHKFHGTAAVVMYVRHSLQISDCTAAIFD